jgi:HlyD family secretion protein
LLYFLVVFAGIVLPWAMLSKVDETGSARGRLEPQGKVFKVDAPVAGTVAKVLVKEGQLVKDKQPLLELESEEIKSELQQAQTKLEGQQNRLAQLELMKNQLLLGVRAQQQQNKAQELEKQAQVEQARQNLSLSGITTTYKKRKNLLK